MAEIFGRNRVMYEEDNQPRRGQYHNMVNDPFLMNYGQGYNNCCGLNANGEETMSAELLPSPPIKTKVMNLQTINYAKTILAVIGAYAIVKFLIGKFSKTKT